MNSQSADHVEVHRVIARALAELRVRTLFGLIGDANLFLVDSFIREFGGTYVAAANEGGAMLMALGLASASDEVGVATVTHGPGLSNTVTALVEGVKARLPAVLLAGDTAVTGARSFQDIPQRDLIVATGAGFQQLRSPATVVEDIERAFRLATIERRPMVLNMPVEMMWEKSTYRSPARPSPQSSSIVCAGLDLENAVGIIAAARKPLILAGRGCARPMAREALVALSRRTGALLGTTLKARNLFSGEEWDLGVIGTVGTPPALDEALSSDCVMVFGAELNRFTTMNGALLANRRIIRCDVDPARLDENVLPDARLLGDVVRVAEAITQWLDIAEIPASGVPDPALRDRLDAYDPGHPDLGTSTSVDIRRALAAIDQAMPKGRVVVTDAGRFMPIAWETVSAPDPLSFINTVNFGSIGLGLSEAIGGYFGSGRRPVLAICGDGGFMNGGLAEFNTAVRHEVNLVVVICNDGAYGAEEIQLRNKELPSETALLNWPDFAPLAVALGGEAITVRNAGDLAIVATAIASRSRPLLIDLKLDHRSVPKLY